MARTALALVALVVLTSCQVGARVDEPWFDQDARVVLDQVRNQRECWEPSRCDMRCWDRDTFKAYLEYRAACEAVGPEPIDLPMLLRFREDREPDARLDVGLDVGAVTKEEILREEVRAWLEAEAAAARRADELAPAPFPPSR